MLINQILSQQRLGQESNCTIFVTATTGTQFWMRRESEAEGVVLRGCKEEKVCTGRGRGLGWI